MPKKEKTRSRPKAEKSQEKPNSPRSESRDKPEIKQPNKQEFSLYDLLQVKNDASSEDIKKQYRKLVLQYHPDKNKEDPLARQKFQKLKEAYDILMDEDKRKEYDETGTVGQDFNQGTFEAAYNYYRTIYKKVTPQDIKSFQQKYRYGPMEVEDLTNYYNQHQGDMVQLIQCIPLSTNEDIPRFIQFFQDQIQKKTLRKFKAFDKTKGKVRLLKDQSEQLQKQRLKDIGSLVSAIQAKSHRQSDFLAELQKKYGSGNKTKAEKGRKKKQKQ